MLIDGTHLFTYYMFIDIYIHMSICIFFVSLFTDYIFRRLTQFMFTYLYVKFP